jgi:hypothetical protein
VQRYITYSARAGANYWIAALSDIESDATSSDEKIPFRGKGKAAIPAEPSPQPEDEDEEARAASEGRADDDEDEDDDEGEEDEYASSTLSLWTGIAHMQ